MKLSCLAATLALVGALAGCGSSASKQDSHAEYQEHLAPVARDVTDVMNGFQKLAAASIVYPAKPNDAKKARRVVERMRSTLRAAATDLDDVTPPPVVARAHAELTRTTRKLADDLGPVIKQLTLGNLVSVGELPTLPGVAEVHRALTAIAAKGYSVPRSARSADPIYSFAKFLCRKRNASGMSAANAT
jgi:hypothetical protein